MAETNPLNLNEVMARWRWTEKLTVREAAKRIGIRSPSTICRLEAGEDVGGESLVAILTWLLSPKKDGRAK